ncbi:MAG: GntR family transcriptional regulator [Clostridia bacterium]|nr:GntR family transcriptional regulator [Clostridia bacterium]
MAETATLKDRVYAYIVDHIARGDLRAGNKINEAAVCEELGVSRTPVREALILLASEDILESYPHKGFVIKPLTDRDVEELYEIIGALDGLTARLACGKLSEPVLKEMEFYLLSMDLAINTENYDMYYKLQETFHNFYMDACSNATLVEMLRKAKRKLLKRRYDITDPEQKKQILLITNSQHKEMLAMLRGGRAEELEQYVRSVHWKPEKAVWESFHG